MDKIIGALEVQDGISIMTGGFERIIGESSKWHFRQKYINYKYRSKHDDLRSLLKIVDLSIPVTFNKKVFYDDGEETKRGKDDKGCKEPSKISKKMTSEETCQKALQVLKESLMRPVEEVVDKSINDYNLRSPLFWILSDTVKYLSMVIRRRKPNMRKIKISPEMADLVENIWSRKSCIKYVVNDDSIPNNLVDLVIHMLEIMKKNKLPRGKWSDPRLVNPEYPCICTVLQKNVTDKIKEKISEMTDEPTLANVKKHIMAILFIENLLIEHIFAVEMYYVVMAEDMAKVLSKIKKFFQPSAASKSVKKSVKKHAKKAPKK